MRRKIVFLLIVVVLCCGMHAHAEDPGNQGSSESGNGILEESSSSPDIIDEAEKTEGDADEKSGVAAEMPSVKSDGQDMEGSVNGEQEEEPEQADLLNEETVSETDKDVLYQVSFPASTKAYLDPGNLSGKGQVFSEQYQVVNYGNTDIEIRLKNIRVNYLSEDDIYEFTDGEITDAVPGIKKMNINIVWKNQDGLAENVTHVSEGERDETVLRLKAAEYDENGECAGPAGGGTGLFYFSGTLNPNPNLVWEDGEISVSFDYEIVNAEEINAEEEKETE